MPDRCERCDRLTAELAEARATCDAAIIAALEVRSRWLTLRRELEAERDQARAELAAAQAALDRASETVDDIEDEEATRCCNRGPRQPCNPDCEHVAAILDRLRAALSVPEPSKENET